MYKVYGKRILDILVATGLFLLFSPVFIFICVILFFANKGSIFYFQSRPGINGEIFRIIKFKTMRDAYDLNGKPLPDSQRISKVGGIIRKTSFDELPQLFNVIIGDMSMVGPRPLLVEYLPLYDDVQLRRHDLRPGITGWAQVNGRNLISWERKFELDLYYVENIEFLLDIKILIITFFNVIQGKGVSQIGHVTVGPFKGKEVLNT